MYEPIEDGRNPGIQELDIGLDIIRQFGSEQICSQEPNTHKAYTSMADTGKRCITEKWTH